MDQAKIADLKREHGEHLALVDVDGEEIVLKKPSRAQWTRFREGVTAGQAVAAGSQLLMDSLALPAWPKLVEIIERAPAIEDDLIREVRKLAEGSAKVSAKKL